MFFTLLNKIKVCNIIKKKNLITNINSNELNLIKKLIKLNIIKFIFKKNNKYIITLNLYKKNKLIFNLKNLYKTSNYKNLNYKNLKKINKKNKLLIISSNAGIINNFEAEKKKIGGILLAYIWN